MNDKYTLMLGDCLERMKEIPDGSVDMVLTDPPYFKVKRESWDRQWDKPERFLEWLGNVADEWYRVLAPNGSLYCFASPQMLSRVEVLLGGRFNVLNNIVWDKGNIGRHRLANKESLRAFFPRTERIIFCEHLGADNMAKGEAGYQRKCDELRGFVFEPLRAYLAGERDRAGFTTRQVAEAFQKKTGSRTVTGMAGHWFERVQWTMPTEKNYEWLRRLFSGDYLRREYEDLRREYEGLRREYEDLRREYEDLRRPFSVTKDDQYTDVWDFKPVQAYKDKHPCEKPQEMLRHIIKTSTREGATVLDSFMGTGSSGIAATNLGRKFIGIELDEKYFAIAERRIKDAYNTLF